jgi:hypothetical protein
MQSDTSLMTQSRHGGHLQNPTSSGARSSEKQALQVNLGLADSAAQDCQDILTMLEHYFSRPAECLLSGVERTLFRAAQHVR